MRASAPVKPHASPKVRPSFLTYNGRQFPLLWEPSGWRLRSKAKSHPADFRTGTSNLRLAQQRGKEWLEKNADNPITSRKGGGTLAALAKIYEETPKKVQERVAKDNVGRLKTICRVVLGKTLEQVTCREVTPDLWQNFQRAMLEKAGRKFDLVTRYRENIGINSAVRSARSMFVPAMLRAYAAAALSVRPDAGQGVLLPEPWLPPAKVDDAALQKAWMETRESDVRMYRTIGLARFGGLRQEEIIGARCGWIEERDGVVSIGMRDRPDEEAWTKTGKPYLAQIIDPDFADYLLALRDTRPASEFIVPSPEAGTDRLEWFGRKPQQWLRAHGIGSTPKKPLHRLRGLYADSIAKLSADAVAARLAGIRAAQQNLGHTTSATTERHYLSADAVR